MIEKKDFCCDLMYESIIEDKTISYNQIVRHYGLHYILPNDIKCVSHLSYCPFCGSKIPKDLVREIFEILRKDYGIEDPDICEFTNVPEEFKTDEWWKKRGI
jgi:hydrogenase maturation factor